MSKTAERERKTLRTQAFRLIGMAAKAAAKGDRDPAEAIKAIETQLQMLRELKADTPELL